MPTARVRGESRAFLRQATLDELKEACRREWVTFTGYSKEELVERLARKCPSLGQLITEGGPFSVDVVNDVLARLGDEDRRRSFASVRAAIRDRLQFGEELDEADDLARLQDRGADGLDSLLRRRDWLSPLRKALAKVDRRDLELFKELARNREPRPISRIDLHGFATIADLLRDDGWRDFNRTVNNAPDAFTEDDRRTMFWRTIDLIHRVRSEYRVYVGRTYLRAANPTKGPRQRWTAHREKSRPAVFARPLGVVPRDRVERDEALGIALVKLWHKFDMLCCENDVLDSLGPVSEDPRQMVYLYMRPH